MSAHDDGGPAFPRAGSTDSAGRDDYPCEGMSLRDWFAGQALANDYTQSTDNPDKVAEWAYQVADAMLAESAKAGKS